MKLLFLFLLLQICGFSTEVPTEELYTKLGIPGLPMNQDKDASTDKEVSSYMMELYHQRHKILGSGPGLATTVSAMPSIPDLSYQASEERWIFTFKLSNITLSESIIQAHLRLYKKRTSLHRDVQRRISVFHSASHQSMLASNNYEKHYYRSLYDDHKVVRLLDTKLVDSKQGTWLSFDVAEAIRMQTSIGTKLLELEVVVAVVNPLNSPTESRGIKFVSRSRGKQKEPLLVVFSKEDTQNDIRLARSDESLSANYDPTKNFCQLKELFVDFERLGWRWIISPPGFEANMCVGECPLSFSTRFKVANHAIIQNFMASKFEGIPKPCCSPTKYSPISLIYMNVDEVIIREYSQMKVEQCGCQ